MKYNILLRTIDRTRRKILKIKSHAHTYTRKKSIVFKQEMYKCHVLETTLSLAQLQYEQFEQ